MVMINNVQDLESLGKDSVAVISSGVGAKKKYEIARTALRKKLAITNFNPEIYVKKVEESMLKRKAERKSFLESRDKKAKAKKKDEVKKKDAKKLEVREGTKKQVYKKEKTVKGSEKDAIKGLK
jgi:hypothetical protein